MSGTREGAIVNQCPAVPAVRTEADDLRSRSVRLRESSRGLQRRSQLWRSWTPRAGEIQRLLDAETDLERAIAECTSALEEVRRELRGPDAGIPPVVH
jgi:hypothetical protein